MKKIAMNFLLMVLPALTGAGNPIPFNLECQSTESTCESNTVLPDPENEVCWQCMNSTLCQCTRNNDHEIGLIPCTPQFYYNNTCHVECPDGTFIEGSKCTTACSQGKVVFREQFCLDSCPSGYRVFGRYPVSCVKECGKGYYAYNDTCIYKCRSDKPFDYDGVCLTQCPDYVHYIQPPTTCVDRCDPCYTCRGYCPKEEFPRLYNETCIASCPASSNMTVDYHNDPKCYSNCPVYYARSSNSTICTRDCPPGTVLVSSSRSTHRDQCVTECKHGHSFEFCWDKCDSTEDECVAKCPDNQKYQCDHECYTNCLNINYYEMNHVCENDTCYCRASGCPPDQKFLSANYTCLASCPASEPYYTVHSHENQCHDTCPMRYVHGEKILLLHVNGRFECLEKCPTDFPFKLNNTCFADCPATNPFHDDEFNCLKKCRETSDDTKGCVSPCKGTVSPFFDHGSCIKHCPTERPYNEDGICTDDCRDMFISQKNDTCVVNCSNDYHWIYNKHCLERCPDTTVVEMKYYLPVRHVIPYCQDACDNPNRWTYRDDQGVTYCIPDGCSVYGYEYKVPETKQCVSRCPAKSFIDPLTFTCLSICPKDAPYQVQGDDGITCKDDCPLPYVHNQICLTSCSSDEFYYKGTNRLNHCVSECPQYYILSLLDPRLCVPCSQINPYFYKNKCLSSCPTDTIVLKDKDQIPVACVSDCPKDHYLYHKGVLEICTAKCPDELVYLSGNTCLLKCPDEYQCTTSCPDHKFAADMGNVSVCVDHCPSGHPYSFNRICVHSCPPDHKPYFISSDNVTYAEVKGDLLCKPVKQVHIYSMLGVGLTLLLAGILSLSILLTVQRPSLKEEHFRQTLEDWSIRENRRL